MIALPMTLALQWAIRSRYLSRRSGLACLAHDRLVICALALLVVELPLMLLHAYGPLAGMFVAIWVGGTVMARRGWALAYGLLLVTAVIGLEVRLSAYPLLEGLTARDPRERGVAVAYGRRALGRTRRSHGAGAVGGRDRRRAGWVCSSATRASAGVCTAPSRRSPCCRRCSAASGAATTCGSSTTRSLAGCRGWALEQRERSRHTWLGDGDLPRVDATPAGHDPGAIWGGDPDRRSGRRAPTGGACSWALDAWLSSRCSSTCSSRWHTRAGRSSRLWPASPPSWC